MQNSEEILVRTLFISDLHLGFRFSQTNRLLQLLKRYRPDNLYVVGDFIDGWYVNRGWHWRPECSQIISRLFELSRLGTRLRFVVGNHDRFLHEPLLQQILIHSGAQDVGMELQHRTADGRDFLVTHGDAFDEYEKLPASIGWLFCRAYELMLLTNHWWSQRTTSLCYGPSALIDVMRKWLPSMANHIQEFQSRTTRYARSRGFQGIICGHIHAPRHETLDGVTYFNIGDWIESCTALVEENDGRMWLLRDRADPVAWPASWG